MRESGPVLPIAQECAAVSSSFCLVLRSSTKAPKATRVGSRFRGHQKHGCFWWSLQGCIYGVPESGLRREARLLRHTMHPQVESLVPFASAIGLNFLLLSQLLPIFPRTVLRGSGDPSSDSSKLSDGSPRTRGIPVGHSRGRQARNPIVNERSTRRMRHSRFSRVDGISGQQI